MALKACDAEDVDVPGWFKSRYILAFLGFLGIAVLYALRVNLSVAIVTMVEEDGMAWDEGYQGFILAGFFYGYAVGQLPGGLLAERYGGKVVFGMGTLVTAVLTIASPWAASLGGGYFFAIRLLEGLFEGVTFPAIQYMISKWSPPAERSRFAIVYTGGYLGTVICMPVCGLLCDLDFIGGWPLAFYVFGVLGVIWYLPWHFCVFDSPSEHPRIDPRERRFIERAVNAGKQTVGTAKPPIPWGPLLRTRGLWACASMHLGIGWAFFTLLTCLPTYMANVLNFDIKSNSLLSAIPYVMGGTSSVIFSFVLDSIITRGLVRKLTAYIIFNGITALGPALTLILVTLVDCNTTAIMVLLALNGLFLGAQYTGNSINLLLLAPNFAGTTLGISNTFANGAGIMAPYAVGLLTNGNQTAEAWNIVFYISAGIGVGTYVVYLFLCQGEVQPWNEWNDTEKALAHSTVGEDTEKASRKPDVFTTGIDNPAYTS